MENAVPENDEMSRLDFEDEDFYERRDEQREPTTRMLCFRLDREWYGVELQDIMEIIRVNQITYLPSGPAYIAGICNLRGNIISVMDPKKLFGLEHQPLTDQSRIVVVASGGVETGLLVDEVSAIVDVAETAVDAPLTTLASEKAQYLKGVVRHGERLVTLLNLRAIMSDTRTKVEE